jgi:hypothetical protein
MKRMIIFVVTVCLCYGSFLNAYGQTGKRQPRPQRKISQPQKPPAEDGKPQTSTAAPAQQQKPSEEPATTPEAWQTSFSAFVREVAEWGGDKPGASLIAMNHGQVVPSKEWEIMKKYENKKVTWEATFQGMKQDWFLLSDKDGKLVGKEMDKVDLKFGMDKFSTNGSSWVINDPWIHVYTQQTEVARWKEVSAGSRISFSALVVGIAYFQASPGLMCPTILLTDAKLVKVLP